MGAIEKETGLFVPEAADSEPREWMGKIEGDTANESATSSAATTIREERAPEAKPSTAAAVMEVPEDVDTDTEPAPPSSGPKPWRHRVLVMSLYLALFLPSLDSTIISTALPRIMSSLDPASREGSGYTWIGTSYGLAQAVVLPLFGQASEVWGRKTVLMAAIVLFTVGSGLCGAAQSVRWLIASRAVQGAGGGGLTGLVYIVMGDLVGTRERGKYQGFVGAVWAVSSALGPVLGGVFAEKTGWRWCFLVNLPLCAVCLVIIFVFLRHVQAIDTSRRTGREALGEMDVTGITVIGTATVLLLLAFEMASQGTRWTSPKVLVCLILAVLGVIAFVAIEVRAAHPIMALRFFRHVTRAGAFAAALFHAVAWASLSYYAPLYFQGVRGQSAAQSGVSLLPLVVPLGAISAASGYVITVTKQYRAVIWISFVAVTLGCGLLLLLDEHTSKGVTVVLLILVGAAAGPNFNSMLIPVHASFDSNRTPVSDIALSTSTYTFIRCLGVSLGISIGGLVCFDQLAQLSGQGNGHVDVTAAIEMIRSLSGAEREAAVGVFLQAMHHVFLTCTALMGAATVASFFIGRYELGDTVRSNQQIKKPTSTTGDQAV